MKLRIVGGLLGGTYITIPDKSVHFRPTQERVRQSIAEKIKHRIPDAAVADICAGSGAFGAEMLSRGAQSVHFVEENRPTAQRISDYLATLSDAYSGRVFIQNARVFVQKCSTAYDIIFYDPPYGDSALAQLVPALLLLLSERGILIYEYALVEAKKRNSAPLPAPDGFSVETREYGDTLVDFITRA
jgi:16S rRNA (guanine966-N2)-methyltransferase